MVVACDPPWAFRVFAEKTGKWWPPSHTVSGVRPLEVVFEPRPGGRIFERTPDGTEHDWGEVVVWEPPDRLVYLWHLRTDRSAATEVEITFTEDPQGTAIRIVHGGWDRLGDTGEERRDGNRAGWAGLVPHYLRAIVEEPRS
jgi:uncharacterized protein YndB with AHSA1/START domain